MTRDEILSMPAGREMDALVAERVMGLSVPPGATTERTVRRVCDDLGGRGAEWVIEYPPYYSTSIAAAWELVEQRHAHGDDTIIILHALKVSCGIGPSERNGIATDVSAPLAICRAALLAVMSE